MGQDIKIIHYGSGNIASVKNAFARLGQPLGDACSPAEALMADKLIFPGVGHARPAMDSLVKTGMAGALLGFDKAVLGICLGMQLLGGLSDEGPTQGLDIIPLSVHRFGAHAKVPHMGWNQVFDTKGPLFRGVPDGSYFYFVHSYYMERGEYTTATCHYQHVFSAAASRGRFFGLQFHPEKSGDAGMQVLKNFIAL